jgi:hypothetical protein
MAKRLRTVVVLGLSLAGAIAVPVACGSDAPFQLCGEIPAGGCPIGRGGSCTDPSCTGVYDCVGGAWRVTERCSGGGADAGAGHDSGADAADAADAGCVAITVDHTGERTGCAPSLQAPDCPAAAAEECAVEACLTGCTDFFLCTSGGWREVAYCDDSGDVVVSGRQAPAAGGR